MKLHHIIIMYLIAMNILREKNIIHKNLVYGVFTNYNTDHVESDENLLIIGLKHYEDPVVRFAIVT